MHQDISKFWLNFHIFSQIIINDNTEFNSNEAEEGSDLYFGSSGYYSEEMNRVENVKVYDTVGNSLYGDKANMVITNVEFKSMIPKQ